MKFYGWAPADVWPLTWREIEGWLIATERLRAAAND